MRYSIYFAWFLTVLSLGILTTLASLPGFTTGEPAPESKIVLGAYGSRSIKVQRVRCHALKPACHTPKQKSQQKTPV